jgi:SAM-dependent methyltransferase
MSACCSTFEHTADQQFNQKKAASELQRYRTKGPRRTTRLLQEGIARAGVLHGTLLDVGSGIGGLTFGLLERGISHAVAVDASSAYLGAARQEAERRGRGDAIHFVHADFVSVASQLPTTSVVALDRVVCCYPSCELLLESALRRAEQCLALSYPRDVWYVRLGMKIENGQRWLTRNPFRTFVHAASAMEHSIARAGFELSSRAETWMWAVDVYVRRSVAPNRRSAHVDRDSTSVDMSKGD